MDLDDLRNACQHEKLKTNTGLTLLNRKLSIYLTRFCIKIGVSANQATVSSIITGIIGSLFFIPGSWWLNILGILLLWLSFTLDQVDGELARYYHTVNLGGVYLDEVRHILIYAVTVFCLSFSPARQLESYIPIFLGFLGAMVLVISRVEERLPYMIFVDKIIMKRNFTYGTIPFSRDDMVNSNIECDNKTQTIVPILKPVLYVIYHSFAFIADQGGILISLFCVTLADYMISIFMPGLTVTVQFIFLILFSLSGALIIYRTIFSHWKEAWVEQMCQEIIDKYDIVSKET